MTTIELLTSAATDHLRSHPACSIPIAISVVRRRVASVATLVRRFLSWINDGSDIVICDEIECEAAVIEIATLRRAAIVAALRQFVDSLGLSHAERTHARHELDVICGECGPSETTRHATCSHCGGYAQPLRNETLNKRATIARLRRQVIALNEGGAKEMTG